MKKLYKVYPRNFGNEFTYMMLDTEEVMAINNREDGSVEMISSRELNELKKMFRKYKKELKTIYKSHGFYFGEDCADEFIRYCNTILEKISGKRYVSMDEEAYVYLKDITKNRKWFNYDKSEYIWNKIKNMV